jgi:1-acyl-sn-glycerol-3-phosphate acyltransferase
MFKCIAWICGTKLTVLGEENVPKEEAVLYVANHRSMLDIVLTYSRCPGLTGYVVKNAVEKVPGLRAWMRRLHCLFINRDDMKQSMKIILSAIDHIKNGISIFIFPEGTRNREREDSANVLDFKDGSFKIAQKTGCKIVPVAITGTAEIFENHFPWVKACKVVIEYGKPIAYKDLDPTDQKHVGAYFQKQIKGMLEAHKTL